jgi:hypothetical protein
MNSQNIRIHALAVMLAVCLTVIAVPPAYSTHDPDAANSQYSEATEAYHRGDYAFALENYQVLAEHGMPLAQYALGWMYQYGLGTEVDYEQALKWLRLAAEQGVDRAQYNLGYMYHHAWAGVEEDFDEALRWYGMAAAQGNAFADYEIGWMYFYGQGVEKDVEKAIANYELAAGKKFNRALNTLGSIYFEGDGVNQNYVLAHMWWTIALTTEETAPNKQDDYINEVKASLFEVEALMSESEIAVAKELAEKRMAQ